MSDVKSSPQPKKLRFKESESPHEKSGIEVEAMSGIDVNDMQNIFEAIRHDNSEFGGAGEKQEGDNKRQ